MNELELKQELTPVVQQAASLRVNNPENYSFAAEYLKAVKAAQKKVVDFFKPMKDAANKAHKEITGKEASAMIPLKEAEDTIKRKMLDYATEQERIRQEAQRKLQAAADLKARQEREALEKKAASMKTEEKRQQYAEQAAAVVSPVVEVATITPEIKGQSIKKTWRCKVIDASLVPREWMLVNESALNAFARSTKGSVKVAGCEMVEESSLSSSSK